MRYTIYIPLNAKDLTIELTMVAYGNRQDATKFAQANNSETFYETRLNCIAFANTSSNNWIDWSWNLRKLIYGVIQSFLWLYIVATTYIISVETFWSLKNKHSKLTALLRYKTCCPLQSNGFISNYKKIYNKTLFKTQQAQFSITFCIKYHICVVDLYVVIIDKLKISLHALRLSVYEYLKLSSA